MLQSLNEHAAYISVRVCSFKPEDIWGTRLLINMLSNSRFLGKLYSVAGHVSWRWTRIVCHSTLTTTRGTSVT